MGKKLRSKQAFVFFNWSKRPLYEYMDIDSNLVYWSECFSCTEKTLPAARVGTSAIPSSPSGAAVLRSCPRSWKGSFSSTLERTSARLTNLELTQWLKHWIPTYSRNFLVALKNAASAPLSYRKAKGCTYFCACRTQSDKCELVRYQAGKLAGQVAFLTKAKSDLCERSRLKSFGNVPIQWR